MNRYLLHPSSTPIGMNRKSLPARIDIVLTTRPASRRRYTDTSSLPARYPLTATHRPTTRMLLSPSAPLK